MTTVSVIREESRAAARARIRDLALDAAREAVLRRGWNAVRMSAIATTIGTSRQTLHAEFGTKDDLGMALIVRETSTFFDDVARRLASHPDDLTGAVEDAALFALTAIQGDPVLQAALTGASGDETLLPLLTTRSDPLMQRAIDLLRNWVEAQWPDVAGRESTTVTVEAVVRLLFSHAMVPTKAPEQAARELALIAEAGLR